MRAILRLLGLALVSLGLACASGTGGGGGDGFGGLAESPPTEVTIVFENRQFTDCTVYYHWTGGRRRLGRVTGNSTGRFQAPDSPSGFFVSAAYQAVGSLRTGDIQANAGQVVTITSHTTGNLTFTVQ